VSNSNFPLRTSNANRGTDLALTRLRFAIRAQRGSRLAPQRNVCVAIRTLHSRVTQIGPFTGALFLIDTEALTQSGFQCSVVFGYRSLPLARCVLVKENTVTIPIQPTSAPKSATLHILGVDYRTFPYSFEDKYIVPTGTMGILA
jgi:hypothetical protein